MADFFFDDEIRWNKRKFKHLQIISNPFEQRVHFGKAFSEYTVWIMLQFLINSKFLEVMMHYIYYFWVSWTNYTWVSEIKSIECVLCISVQRSNGNFKLQSNHPFTLGSLFVFRWSSCKEASHNGKNQYPQTMKAPFSAGPSNCKRVWGDSCKSCSTYKWVFVS